MAFSISLFAIMKYSFNLGHIFEPSHKPKSVRKFKPFIKKYLTQIPNANVLVEHPWLIIAVPVAVTVCCWCCYYPSLYIMTSQLLQLSALPALLPLYISTLPSPLPSWLHSSLLCAVIAMCHHLKKHNIQLQGSFHSMFKGKENLFIVSVGYDSRVDYNCKKSIN